MNKMDKISLKKFNINYILQHYFYLMIIILIPGLYIILNITFIEPIKDNIEFNTNFLIESQEKYNYIKYTQLEEIKKIKSDIESLNESDIEKLNKILPDSKDIENLIINIENIVKKSNVEIKSLAINEVLPDKNNNSKFNKVEVVLNIASNDVSTVKNILNDIEKNTRLQDVISIYIQQNETTLINITTYYKS